MTKAELLKMLEPYDDDAPIHMQWTDVWNIHEVTSVIKMMGNQDPIKGKRFPVLLPEKLQ